MQIRKTLKLKLYHNKKKNRYLALVSRKTEGQNVNSY